MYIYKLRFHDATRRRRNDPLTSGTRIRDFGFEDLPCNYLASKFYHHFNPIRINSSLTTTFMMKSVFTFICTLLAIYTCNAEPDSSPNVLFFAVDDMNDWIGCLGTTPRAITPNIDKLADRGVNFTNAHTAGVFCAPSRAAIFSGQYASTTGCYKTAYYFANKPEIEPLQSSFAKAGYKTLGAGQAFSSPCGRD